MSISPRVRQFTYARRVTVGLSKEEEEVVLRIGAPVERTQEGTHMQEVAKQFWPAIREQVKEMWVYPGRQAQLLRSPRAARLSLGRLRSMLRL